MLTAGAAAGGKCHSSSWSGMLRRAGDAQVAPIRLSRTPPPAPPVRGIVLPGPRHGEEATRCYAGLGALDIRRVRLLAPAQPATLWPFAPNGTPGASTRSIHRGLLLHG